jgi:4,5-dihydroxyphthalate decarboxylase
MANLPLRLACWDYDRTRPLIDGRVQAEGIDLTIHVMRPQQAFRAMLEGSAFDAAEMSLSTYVALRARDAAPFTAIPVMLSKMFRHSCIYVRSDAGIREPADLKGRRVGVTQFASTGVVYMKGLLQHDFGVHQRDMHWFVGGLNTPAEAAAQSAAAPGVVIEQLPDRETLEAMIETGRLDALLTNHFPALFVRGSPRMGRLFPDYKAVEQDYFRRTGIFPVMHVVVIHNQILCDHLHVAASLQSAFCAARDLAVAGLYDTDALRLSLPWLIDHIEETRRNLGPDAFAYGIERNRPALVAFGQYMHEQGFASHVLQPEQMFVAGVT